MVSKLDLKHVDVSLNFDDDMKSDIHLIIQNVKPNWKMENLKTKTFTDGVTNRLIGCYTGDSFNTMETVLLRIYGEKTEYIIDREAEIRTMLLLHRENCCPPVYATFNNGLCYGFQSGTVGEYEMIIDPVISEIIAKEMARLHTLPPHPDLIAPKKESFLPSKMAEWLAIMPDSFPDPVLQQRFEKGFPKRASLTATIKELNDHLAKLDAPIALCHNDALIKNFVLGPNKDRIHWIDFEYADYNYAAFDIGNHFNEFAGMDVLDYSRYPNREFQLVWLRHYLRHRSIFIGQNPDDVTDKDVERLYVLTNKCALASNVFWSVWAIIQAGTSSIDFDYVGFAIERYGEYVRRREEFMALVLPE